MDKKKPNEMSRMKKLQELLVVYKNAKERQTLEGNRWQSFEQEPDGHEEVADQEQLDIILLLKEVNDGNDLEKSDETECHIYFSLEGKVEKHVTGEYEEY